MSGTPSESSLSQHDAVNMLLNIDNAPEQASEEVQEPDAETEVEATEAEAEEVEAVDDDQAETEAEEVEEEPETEEVEVYSVKVDGDEGEATLDELVASYQKTRTADKRLQEAAEARKALDADKASFEQTRVEYTDTLQAMKDFLQQANPEKDDKYWLELNENDPFEYNKQQILENQRLQKLQAVEAEQARLDQERIQVEQQKLLEMIPEWRDQEVASREKQQIVDYVSSKGFTTKTINTLAMDSRLVDMVRKALKFDALQEQKPIAKKKVRKAPKMVKSGQPKPVGNSATERKRKAFDKLRKSGSRDAAVEFLLTR